MAHLPFQPGDLIGGRYRLIRMIGAGAMGAVWSARNESTDRDFALKLMLPDAANNPVALQRFFQEAKASGRLRHRCIVEVYDLGRIEQLANQPTDPRAGTPYLVMELLEGEALDSLLRRVKQLPVGTALRIVGDVARALEIAHVQRIVHRDLKPANLFLHKALEGEIVPKILDFGISKLVGPQHDPIATSAGTVLGSPAYMSPEQAGGELDVDGRSDVWSLGVILYKCLCGTVPFQAANYNALMMAISNLPPKPIDERVPGIPPQVAAIVHKCLAKKREDRFSSAKRLAETIQQTLTQTRMAYVDLESIVAVPIEIDPGSIKTIAAERSVGTLAATEVDDEAETRAMDSSSLPQSPNAASTAQLTADRTVAPSFRAAKWRSVWVALGAAGLLACAAVIGIAANRRSMQTRPPTSAGEPAFAATTATVATVPLAPSPAAVATPANSVASSIPPESSVVPSTTTLIVGTSPPPKKPVIFARPAALPKPKPPATGAVTAKPPNEGVTGAGF